MDEMLAKVKLAVRQSSTTFDSELTDLINAALLDMGVAGVTETETSDPLIIRAVFYNKDIVYDNQRHKAKDSPSAQTVRYSDRPVRYLRSFQLLHATWRFESR